MKSDTPFPHFMEKEFFDAVPSCNSLQMDSSFMKHIEDVRVRSGVPFHINSAYRTPEYEHSKGRSGNSFHCVGQAIDIACKSSTERYKILEAVMFYGILSVVLYPTFIHFDNRPVRKVMLCL